MKQETKEKLARLLMSYRMSERDARDLTSIITFALRFDALDWVAVARMLAPTHEYDGITDPVLRAQAASEWLRIYIAETSDPYLSRWAGIMMWVGDTPGQSSAWLRDHGYLPYGSVN